MAAPTSQIFSPFGFQDLFSIWSRYPDAVLFAGGSEFIRKQGSNVPILPRNIISLDNMAELKKISRTERYLEIGAMVKLNQIIQLGKIVPDALSICIEGIAGPHLLNIATVGGNICCHSRRLDLAAPMTALDAQFELRTAQTTRWISASRFLCFPGSIGIADHEILTRIRVPLEPWTYTWYLKLHSNVSSDPAGSMLFMIRNQKDVLTNIRVVYSGKTVLREKSIEGIVEGKYLPLDSNTAENFAERWKSYLAVLDGNEDSIYPGEDENFCPDLTKTQILNFIETNLMHISD